MDLHALLPGILKRLSLKSLNTMQEQAIRIFSDDQNLLLLSPTGSGKTLAYLLSLVHFLDPEKKRSQALVVVPSRELALQIDEVFRKTGLPFKVTLCYGGHKREIEENNLIEAPHILIGTTGRLADHLRRGSIDPSCISLLVLDEFDKTLELGFEEELQYIISRLPARRKSILTSATAAPVIPSFLEFDPFTVLDLVSDNSAYPPARVEVFKLRSPQKDKLEALFDLLCFANNRPAIVFCNHRDAVERTAAAMAAKGIRTVFYHGGMEQRDRESELAMFRNGSSNVLVTTDLASRGLDIKGIRYIIHYHLPPDESVYTHRNGRTARMEDFGTVVLLLSGDEEIPGYITDDVPDLPYKENTPIPSKPDWSTLIFSLGKKDKVNKIDILGFLTAQASLKGDDVGIIDVKDFMAFAAIRRNRAGEVLRNLNGSKLKNKKVTISIAATQVKQ